MSNHSAVQPVETAANERPIPTATILIQKQDRITALSMRAAKRGLISSINTTSPSTKGSSGISAGERPGVAPRRRSGRSQSDPTVGHSPH